MLHFTILSFFAYIYGADAFFMKKLFILLILSGFCVTI